MQQSWEYQAQHWSPVLSYIHDNTKHSTGLMYSPPFKTITITALVSILSYINDNTKHRARFMYFPTFMTISNTALVSVLSYHHYYTMQGTGSPTLLNS